MRLSLAMLIFLSGIAITFRDMRPDLLGPYDFLGFFMMLTGAVQVAFIAGSNMFPYTPPALERLFVDDRQVLWIGAPLVALVGILIRLGFNLTTGTS
jgi:hypothetical protein